MISPMPVDELPSFIDNNQVNTKPAVNPILKYVIVGGTILITIITVYNVINRKQPKNKIKQDEDNESQTKQSFSYPNE